MENTFAELRSTNAFYPQLQSRDNRPITTDEVSGATCIADYVSADAAYAKGEHPTRREIAIAVLADSSKLDDDALRRRMP